MQHIMSGYERWHYTQQYFLRYSSKCCADSKSVLRYVLASPVPDAENLA